MHLISVYSVTENNTVVAMAAKKRARQSNTDMEYSKLTSRSLILKSGYNVNIKTMLKVYDLENLLKSILNTYIFENLIFWNHEILAFQLSQNL